MPSATEGRAVKLAIPARPEFVGLARLALSAVCRLTPLPPEDVADLKLAITEAANALIGYGDAAGHSDGDGVRLAFMFRIAPGRLEMEVEGGSPGAGPHDERDLGRAIIEATVDEWDYAERRTRLVRHL